MKKFIIPITLLALTGIQPAFANDVTAFEGQLRSAYGSYRTALFATNMGKAEESAKAVAKFTDAWTAIAGAEAPPQYADDPAYQDTMTTVAEIATMASDEIEAGDFPKAHETLEDIRDQIGDLHIRNNIFSFSDRMNAYHARMEEVLAMDGTDTAKMREETAVLEYLLADIVAHPPTEADAGYEEMLNAVKGSVAKLRAGAESGDAGATKAAIDGLKAPYSKLFLNFG